MAVKGRSQGNNLKRKVKVKNKKRIIASFFVIATMLIALSLRLAWIQVVKSDEYTQKAIDQQMSDIPLEAERGDILDTNGIEMATSATCYSVWIHPGELARNYKTEEIDKLGTKLAEILGNNKKRLISEMKSNKSLLRVAKYLDEEKRKKVEKLQINGLEISEGTKRYYPMGYSAANLLGSVSDESVGRTGIEAEFDGYLSGVAGRWLQDTDLHGNVLSYGSKRRYQARNGYDVQLTVDSVLQHFAESAVKRGMRKTKAKRIMCIIMNPKTGDILAMVNNPGFDANYATKPNSDGERAYFNRLNADQKTKYLSRMWSNPIVSDLYEPGSTFKLITTSSALEEGVTTPTTHYYDSGSYVVDGTRIYCWNKAGHGDENLIEAVGNSCNPVQMQLALSMGKDKYYNYLEMFGISDITGVDLPAETSAIIKEKKDLTNLDLATMSFGQGIALTPMQLITAACGIVNNGIMMKPRIVKAMTDDKGKTVKEFPMQKIRKVISAKTSHEMRGIMEYVVSEGGGNTAYIPGYRIGGKTGTANKAKPGGYSKDVYASFLGVAPMDDPQLAVLVIVDTPKGIEYGSVNAAPIAKDIFMNAFPHLGLEPNYSNNEKTDKDSNNTYVPNVTGKRYSEAKAELNNIGLKSKIGSKKAKGDFNVVDQYPKSGKYLKKGSYVYLYSE